MGSTAADQLASVWKSRVEQVINDEAVNEFVSRLADSPAELSASVVVGGQAATGLGLRLEYEDEITCGNDLQWLLELLKKFPPSPPPPEPYHAPIRITEQSGRFSVLLALGVLPPEAFDVIGQQRQLRG